jgi:photosystem II stability/assembly factor-like uncharacterized protein
LPKLPLVLAAAALLVAGCGGDGDDQGSALVDPAVDPPINSLEIDRAGQGLLLTTNRGFYRIEDGEATRVSSEARTPDGRVPVGTFLTVSVDDGRLIGSGHPDRTGRVADFLGALSSRDDGETWSVESRYAFSDLHVIHSAHGMLYAFDAVLDSLLISRNHGRTWEERGGPPERVIDFVVDPEDPDQLLASTAKEIFRSTDGGRRWSATVAAPFARLAWPSAQVLRRADEDGLVYASDNAGASWEPIESVDGEPWKLRAAGDDELYLALADATILASTDGGESWQEHFTP